MTIQENTTYNGWTNWDTWEAYNWLTSGEWIYEQYARCYSTDQIRHLLLTIDENESGPIDVYKVNFEELLASIEDE